MIRKPIGKPLQIGLALASMISIIVGYGILAASQADHGLYNKSFPSLTQLYYGLGSVLASVEARENNDDIFSDVRSAKRKVVRYHKQIESSQSPNSKPEEKLGKDEITSLSNKIEKLEKDISEYEAGLISPIRIFGRRVSDLFGGTSKVDEDGDDERQIYLYMDFSATMTRLLYGVLITIAGGVALGFAMGTLSPVESFLNPPMSIASKLNPIAMLAVFFVVVGSGENLYLSMIVFGTLPALTITVYIAIKNDVPDELIYKAYSLGASHAEVIGLVIFRKVLPHIIEGVRAMVGPALVYLIAAEWAIGSVGFGYRLRLQSKLLDMQLVFSYIAFLAIFGYLIDLGLVALLNYLCPWHTQSEASEGGIFSSLTGIFKSAFGLSESPAAVGKKA